MDSISFKALARTIDHLGREQIADAPTAVSELWKNSFDAYLRVGDSIRTLGFIDPTKEDSNPDWEQMFALDKGKFGDGMKFKLAVVRENEGTLVLKGPTEVMVVGQLRYEYALNLLQRLGSNLSRVGLDFVYPEPDA